MVHEEVQVLKKVHHMARRRDPCRSSSPVHFDFDPAFVKNVVISRGLGCGVGKGLVAGDVWAYPANDRES